MSVASPNEAKRGRQAAGRHCFVRLNPCLASMSPHAYRGPSARVARSEGQAAVWWGQPAGLQARRREHKLLARPCSRPRSLLLSSGAGRRAPPSGTLHSSMHQGSRSSRQVIPLPIFLLSPPLNAAAPTRRARRAAGRGCRAAAALAAAAGGRCARLPGSRGSGGLAAGGLGGVRNERELQGQEKAGACLQW